MDGSDGWPWGLSPFPASAGLPDVPVPGYGGPDPSFPSEAPPPPGTDQGYGTPNWAYDSLHGQPSTADSAFPGYYPAAPYRQASAFEPTCSGFGAGQEAAPSYGYSAPGEPSYARGTYEGTAPAGRTERSGAHEAERRADPQQSDMASMMQLVRESHEGHLAASREALLSSANAAHYSSQLGAVHETLALKNAEIAHLRGVHALELDSAKWQGFINGVVGLLQVNPHMYLCSSFLQHRQVPPEVMAILEPFIALAPPPGPMMNFLVNGVSFSAGVHQSGVGSVDSVAGGAGGHALSASAFVAADHYVPDIDHIAPVDEEAEDAAAGDEGSDEEATGDEGSDDDLPT